MHLMVLIRLALTPQYNQLPMPVPISMQAIQIRSKIIDLVIQLILSELIDK